jgi:hypothetical protein
MEEGCDRRLTSLSACLQGMPVEKVVAALGELGLPLVNNTLSELLVDSGKNAAGRQMRNSNVI